MDDLCTFLGIVRNPDGSLTRPTIFPLLHPRSCCHQNSSSTVSVQSTDVPLNPSNNTWIRIFRPLLLSTTTTTPHLPIIIYFHGGGFVFLSADAAPIHECCELMACRLPSIVVSVNYRLAPEHPLPAAYADAIDAVRWVQAQQALGSNAWMMGADFSRCFLMGSSAGGNIAYHAALLDLDLNHSSSFPALKIAGVIMDQPFFGGEQRTGSELRLAEDKILPLQAMDVLWQLALPGGADRDHEFCNPIRMMGGGVEVEVEVVQQLPACMVRGSEGDPLVERQEEVVKMLGERGVDVVGRFEEQGCHGVHFFQPHKAEAFFMDVKDFINSRSS
ncbi:hypothetical protein ACLOJK_033614 [Asimina triloba]